eukprot:31463-Pelagococcus_subviridis.AAC.9
MRLSARGVTGDASFYVRARGVFRSVPFGSVPFRSFGETTGSHTTPFANARSRSFARLAAALWRVSLIRQSRSRLLRGRLRLLRARRRRRRFALVVFRTAAAAAGGGGAGRRRVLRRTRHRVLLAVRPLIERLPPRSRVQTLRGQAPHGAPFRRLLTHRLEPQLGVLPASVHPLAVFVERLVPAFAHREPELRGFRTPDFAALAPALHRIDHRLPLPSALPALALVVPVELRRDAADGVAADESKRHVLRPAIGSGGGGKGCDWLVF